MVIKEITRQQYDEMLNNHDNTGEYEPEGKYFMYDEVVDLWIGIDNSTGDCWVEEFVLKSSCFEWLEELY